MKTVFIQASFENLGIQYLSSILKKAGHETDLVFDPRLFNDTIIYNKPLSDIFNFKSHVIKKVLESNCDLIAFSITTDIYNWSLDLARTLKRYINTPIVFGGPHPSAVPEQVLKNEAVDFVISGEGEEALLELAACLSESKTHTAIKNLWYKKNGKIMGNDVRELIRDLDTIPFPDKKLYSDTMTDFGGSYRTIASRGCPFNCSYCHNSMLRKLYNSPKRFWRVRSVDNVIEELRSAKNKNKISSVFFTDDLFPYDIKWLSVFAEMYQKYINLPFWCYVHPTTVNEKTIALLEKAGCATAAIGLDSIDIAVNQKMCHRNVTRDRIERAIKLFHKRKIGLFGGYILGYPEQSSEQLIKDVNFYNENKVDGISVYWIRYYPGTNIREVAKQAGRLKDEDIDKLEKDAVSLRLRKRHLRVREFSKIIHLFYLTCLLPKFLLRFMIRKKIYNFLPECNLAFVFTFLRNRKYLVKYYLGKKRKSIRFVHRYFFYLHYIRVKLWGVLAGSFGTRLRV